MSGTPTSILPRLGNSEGKLYQAFLEDCIERIANFPVNRRTSGPSNPTTPNNTTINPPSLTPSTTMDRSRLHGAPLIAPKGVPPRGPPSQMASPSWNSQDARSNLAVQPSTNATNIRLKKAAVKIVRPAAAGSLPATTSRPIAPTHPAASSSPAPIPAQAQPKVTEGSPPTAPTPAPRAALTRENIKPNDSSESDLDAMFARLNSNSSAKASPAAKLTPSAGPDKDMFSFDDVKSGTDTVRSTATTTEPNPSEGATQTKSEQSAAIVEKEKAKAAFIKDFQQKLSLQEEVSKKAEAELDKAKATISAGAVAGKPFGDRGGMSQEELENKYMRKATEYIDTLPDNAGSTVHSIKSISKKLRSSFVTGVKVDSENIDVLKARFAFAVANYVNKTLKKGPKPLTTDSVKQTLRETDGDFLRLCAKLVEEKYIALENIDEITGLVKTMLDILPKAEPLSTPTTTTPATKGTESLPEEGSCIAPGAQNIKSLSKDPMDSVAAWPTQVKRENPAAHRTCILKGVSGVKSINQLQALVWGGKLESISLPEAGSAHALVKFLTNEACENYHNATANGIEIAGDKKAVVFVEKAEGPNSTNDVIRNCIEGDASRCIRAIGETDYNDTMLMKLACGKDKIKREVDRIKRGKTARGYDFVEFRFANIYHALNFKREIMNDEDWEHCTVSYAPDPCELARGVHYKDADEEDSGFFA